MRTVFYALILIFIVFNANSQDINVEVNGGYGFYELDDVKSLQQSMLESTQIPNLKSVEKFPNGIYPSISVNYFLDPKNSFGITFLRYTTGGRNHLADYSGEYKIDMILNGYGIGTKYQRTAYLQNKFAFILQLEAGVIFSELDMDERLTIYEEVMSNDHISLESTGIYVEPMLKFSYNLIDDFNLQFSSGYNINFKGKMKVDGEKTDYVSNWSGLRLMLGVSYTFKSHKN
ncbi:MAG TPA: hypothetical protein VEP89_04790 [Draconibacterium sp.]|nr:hypothetical protein [Draconibacterium sp.]